MFAIFSKIGSLNSRPDYFLLFATIPLTIFGLITMSSFTTESYYFDRQITWICLAYAAMLIASFLDWRWLRRSGIVTTFYLVTIFALASLFALGQVTKGAQSWFSLGGFSFQPADFMKLALIIILAKYFSKRHVEIANFRHIVVSGLYAFVPFALVLVQPDLGSALIIFLIWLGMVLVSGISKKHLLFIFTVFVVSSVFAWSFLLQPYQQKRLVAFVHPLADIRGSGYNAFQSMVAVGSGELFGKGVGFGTQSRLKFLPEYQTDFIFAAFVEEWGLIGCLIVFLLIGLILWRLVANAIVGRTNFETFFCLGLAIMFISHFVIHVGMNIGLLPVTGLPLPFMSYGGSHLLVEFLGLGIVMGMKKYSLVFHRDDVKNEFIGPQ